MPLTFKVTTAGRAALVNAANTGTLPVLVSQVGVTATAFTAAADGSDLALPGELKRLATFGGAAVADDTIHAVIRDDSADVYTLRGFGLYIGDGTLLGLYGQADPILEKSAGAMMLLATDVIFADIDAASLTFGDASFLNPPATVDTAGVVELATDAEAIAGADGTRAVTPKGLLAKLTALLGAGAPSAFVKTLLTAVDLVAFRTLLAIKTAASYDIGVGNGLDADLLDGQHGAYYRTWVGLTGVPAQFPPSTHGHAWGDLAGVPATATRWPGWAEVTDKPATFPPSGHSHPIGEVNGLQGALDGKQASLGFTPVQQGTGIGQGANAVKLGWDAANGRLRATVDALDLGAIGTMPPNFYPWHSGNFDPATKAPTAAPTFTGRVTLFKELIATSGSAVIATGINSGNNGGVYLRPDGSGSVVGELFIPTGGINWNNQALWHGGNFNPATKANLSGAAFTAEVSSPYVRGGVVAGSCAMLQSGGPDNAGYISFFDNSSARTGYLGNSTATVLMLNPEGGRWLSVGSSASFNGAVTCLTMNASSSDIRLKTDVTPVAPRPLHRLLAALPDTHGALSSYVHRADHAPRLGPIAQDIERVEPAYMGTIEIAEGQVEGVAAGTYKTVDKASAAYEQAMWAGQEIDGLHAVIDALQKRLAELESR